MLVKTAMRDRGEVEVEGEVEIDFEAIDKAIKEHEKNKQKTPKEWHQLSLVTKKRIHAGQVRIKSINSTKHEEAEKARKDVLNDANAKIRKINEWQRRLRNDLEPGLNLIAQYEQGLELKRVRLENAKLRRQSSDLAKKMEAADKREAELEAAQAASTNE